MAKNEQPREMPVWFDGKSIKEGPVCVDDFMTAEKIITKQGFVDALAVKPDGLVGLTRLLVLRHGAAPPFPDV